MHGSGRVLWLGAANTKPKNGNLGGTSLAELLVARLICVDEACAQLAQGASAHGGLKLARRQEQCGHGTYGELFEVPGLASSDCAVTHAHAQGTVARSSTLLHERH